jgi:hypothetical protein
MAPGYRSAEPKYRAKCFVHFGHLVMGEVPDNMTEPLGGDRRGLFDEYAWGSGRRRT